MVRYSWLDACEIGEFVEAPVEETNDEDSEVAASILNLLRS